MTNTQKTTRNTIVSEDSRVILYDELGETTIHGGLGYPYEPYQKDYEAAFEALFEVVKPAQELFFANPTDTFYQGVEAMCVIRRKADGNLFGFQYWKPIAKYDEFELECNGDEHGFEFDVPADFDWEDGYYPSPYVFLPVEPFTITGYKFPEEA